MNQTSDARGKQFATEALEALAVCENAIMRGRLPEVRNWKPVRPLSGGHRSAEYLSPPDAQWIAVKVERASWRGDTQLTCGIQQAWSETLLTRGEVAEVLLTFMEELPSRFEGIPKKALDITVLSPGLFSTGVVSLENVNEDCPIGAMITVSEDPYLIWFRVADRFTWCSK
ncbi:hypothetical protein [uncultured Aliiroseovarius sp.]|uniref:hypothetical protein n=1 Tax=uncultured Aliiroseovarius sp. TaxID=1658783 RepID=UPI0026084B9C|nr:hypothetical protein [uncultured Aliiroseovarius sp.]